jgi:hypothetical protein
MSKIKKALVSVTAAVMLALGLVAFVPAGDVSARILDADGTEVGTGAAGGAAQGREDTMATQLFGDGGVVTNIISVVIFIVGLVCVVMLVWGGIQYILSTGDSGKVTNAKNTILYAVVGLIVCIVAFAVVQFVLVNVGSGAGSGGNGNSNQEDTE